MKLKKIIDLCIIEASQKCFDTLFEKPFKQNYRHCKSRKIKQARRFIIRNHLQWAHEKEIRLIVDDYHYWMARNSHKLLHPNIPDCYYLEDYDYKSWRRTNTFRKNT